MTGNKVRKLWSASKLVLLGWGHDLTTVSGDGRLLAGSAAASVSRFPELTLERAEPAAATGAC